MRPNPEDNISSEQLANMLEEAPPPSGPKQQREKKFPVMEIFGPTIQGEGSVAGMPTYFLRMGGCDYRCERCDSMFAVLPQLIKQHATMMTAYEIFEAIQKLPRLTDAITISGGNPCMWDLTELVTPLYDAGWRIYVETQGTIWQDWLAFCHVTISPKGPGMGETFEPSKFQAFINKCLKFGIEPTLKVVVFDQRDIELMVEILAQYPHLANKAYFSIGNRFPPAPAKRDGDLDEVPGDEMSGQQQRFVQQVLDSYAQIAGEVLNDPRPVIRNVRILPQIHTLLWGNAQGR